MQVRRLQPKIGRNERCPCGSLKKHKHCCGALPRVTTRELPPEIAAHMAEVKALHRRREQQQGLGRPIISVVFGEYRLVAVRNRIMWAKNWKTFHDFLFGYIKNALGAEWGQNELTKPLTERHPILQCYDMLCRFQRQAGAGDGEIKEAAATGAVLVYLNLAYYLYLIDHNAKVQDRLLQRLRNRGEFQAARYETSIAALFALAGFSIEFENESDSTTTHVEFTATHQRSNRKYSVEVKSKHRHGLMWHTAGVPREPDVIGEVRDFLHKALRKSAQYDRIVFIELNLSDGTPGNKEPPWAEQVNSALRAAEQDLTVRGTQAPPAYVLVTNDTTGHNLEGTSGGVHLFASGFHMPDFYSGQRVTIPEAVAARDKHRDILSLAAAVRQWRDVPCTFDGEIPERVHGREAPWQIGQRYVVPTEDGSEAEGVLEEALMLALMSEGELKMWGVYRLDDGRRIICTNPVDEEEMRIYRRYPDTYFGVIRHVGGKLHTPVEMYDFFYDSYSCTPKEKLLDWLKTYQDQAQLQAMTQEQLAKFYCELLANEMLARKLKRENGKGRPE